MTQESSDCDAIRAFYGTDDFITKMQIAVKECYELGYWLELLNRPGYIYDERCKPLQNDCGAIRVAGHSIVSPLFTLQTQNKAL